MYSIGFMHTIVYCLLQLLVDFASITHMQDPMNSFMAKWNIWIPKIYQKVKLEAGLHRKTYLSFLPLLSQYADKSIEDIYGRIDMQCYLIMRYGIISRHRSRHFGALALLTKAIKQQNA